MVILAKLPPADREETELVELDKEFRRDYGPEQVWVPVQWQQWQDAIADVHRRYGKQVAT